MNKTDHSRRSFLKSLGLGAAALSLGRCTGPGEYIPGDEQPNRNNNPNIIICMSDDQGWGDTGYNGHPLLKTPHLDAMASNSLCFDRFYAAAPVCSPTRGSCLTGRHPYRYGIFHANTGHLPKQEKNLATILQNRGYTTGHFGKWHLGTLTRTEKDSNRGGPEDAAHYAPPWERGFDECFSTEAKVPTFNPMQKPPKDGEKQNSEEPYGTYYWSGPDRKVRENLKGDDSRIIMDRAIPFIRNAVEKETPFFAVVWFHAPHKPVLAGPEHRALYKDCPEEAQNYFGCITAMDEQVGRLRKTLKDLGAAANTLFWFCSDNGPEDKKDTPWNGSAGPFRGRKRSLFEGGVRVPGMLEWPARVTSPRRVSMPCSTLDYYPTLLDILKCTEEGQDRPLDGISLVPLIEGRMTRRAKPLAFESKKQLALSDDRFKLISQDGGENYSLFDLIEDPSETRDLASIDPERTKTMRNALDTWRASCKQSLAGHDYSASAH